jgi:hypothetical protein
MKVGKPTKTSKPFLRKSYLPLDLRGLGVLFCNISVSFLITIILR